MDQEQRKEVAMSIVRQLGGRKFMVMTGVKQFITDESGVSFKIGRNGSKCNHVSIEYDCGRDLYNVVFGRIHGGKYRELERTNGCYSEMLVPMFEEFTGLATKLF